MKLTTSGKSPGSDGLTSKFLRSLLEGHKIYFSKQHKYNIVVWKVIYQPNTWHRYPFTQERQKHSSFDELVTTFPAKHRLHINCKMYYNISLL